MESLAVWSSEQVFHRGRDFFAAVQADLAQAQQSIELEVYIFDDDALGRAMVDQLVAAAQRKVVVRVMVDGFGAPDWGARFLPALLAAGVDARVYRPLPWLFLRLSSVRVPSLNRMLRFLSSINRRNHRKVWIMDGRIAYVGSLNITAHHLDEAVGGANWRDTGVRLEGPQVGELAWGFEKAWAHAWRFQRYKRRPKGTKPQRPPAFSGLVRLNDRARVRRRQFKDLLNLIDNAKHRVWVTNPYFVPARQLIRNLRRAAKQGVDVRLLVPRHPDVRFIRWVTAAFFQPLLKAGVRIFEYLPSVLHAKTLLIDDWATVGSSNLNHRSLIHDLEVDVVLTTQEAKRLLEAQFLDDLSRSEEFTPESMKRMSWLGVLAGRLLRLFRYWM